MNFTARFQVSSVGEFAVPMDVDLEDETEAREVFAEWLDDNEDGWKPLNQRLPGSKRWSKVWVKVAAVNGVVMERTQ